MGNQPKIWNLASNESKPLHVELEALEWIHSLQGFVAFQLPRGFAGWEGGEGQGEYTFTF